MIVVGLCSAGLSAIAAALQALPNEAVFPNHTPGVSLLTNALGGHLC